MYLQGRQKPESMDSGSDGVLLNLWLHLRSAVLCCGQYVPVALRAQLVFETHSGELEKFRHPQFDLAGFWKVSRVEIKQLQ